MQPLIATKQAEHKETELHPVSREQAGDTSGRKLPFLESL